MADGSAAALAQLTSNGFSATEPLSDDVPEELRRGIPLRNLLAEFGSLLRRLPHTMTWEERSNLYEKSVRMEELGFFLSHCWASSGWQKYVTLTLHFLGVPVIILSMIASLSVFFLQYFFFELPNLGVRHDDFLQFTFGVSQWEFYAGMVTAWSVMFLGHLFLKSGSHNACFFDSTCIHQTDKDKQQKGISCIAGFLRMSRKLIVLWDPLYLTRGWCAYELASFISIHGSKCVEVLPMKSYVATLVIQLYYLGGSAFFMMIWPTLPGLIGYDAVLAVASLPFFTACAVISESLVDDINTLVSQLETFDLRKCNVSVESDRKMIIERINELYKGGVPEFNKTIRHDIKTAVLLKFKAQRSPLPYDLYLLANIPTMCGHIGYVSCMRHGPAPLQVSFAIYAVSYVGAVFPCIVALVMILGQRFAGPAEEALTLRLRHLIIGTLGAAVLVGGSTITNIVPCAIANGALPWLSTNPWHGPLLATAICACTCPWVYFLFGKQFGRQIPTSSATSERELLMADEECIHAEYF